MDFTIDGYPTKKPHSHNNIGEDAYFFRNIHSNYIFGIADGVGGWCKYGVSSGLISSQLMINSYHMSEDLCDDPQAIMLRAYNLIKNKKEILAGGTTCCIITYNVQTKKLKTACLGDSGYIIIRNNTIIFDAGFKIIDCVPRQLSIVPPELRMIVSNCDDPSHSDVREHQLEKGDIVLLATDGLWDNISRSEVVLNAEGNSVNIANKMLTIALKNNYKPDDITICILKID